MRHKRRMTSLYFMIMTFDDSSKELGHADTGRSASEIPMPEQKTGDVQPSPAEPPHMPGPASKDATPAHPPSDRA